MKDSKEFNQNVLALLKQVVKKRDINYHDLAKRLGVTYSAAHKMLHGRAITVNRLWDLSIALDYNLFAGLATKFEFSEPKAIDPSEQLVKELELRIHDLEVENRTLLMILGKEK